MRPLTLAIVALSLTILSPGCGGGPHGGSGTTDLRPAASSAPVTSARGAAAPAGSVRVPGGPLDPDVEATIVETARNLAVELGLDVASEQTVIRLSRESWRSVEEEVRARVEDPTRGALDEEAMTELLKVRQEALDAEILRSLAPDMRARFEDLTDGGVK